MKTNSEIARDVADRIMKHKIAGMPISVIQRENNLGFNAASELKEDAEINT